MPKWDHLKSQCIIQVVTCLMLIICQRWDISTFAVWHFTTVVWRKPWKGLQWCLHQRMTHQSMYELKSSSQVASSERTTCLTHQWKQRRPLQALLQLIPSWVKGRHILKRKCLIELRHNPTAGAFTIYFSDSPEQKKDFSLEAAKLADVVKHLQWYKLVLYNWCTLMTWCVDMMIITEDQCNGRHRYIC